MTELFICIIPMLLIIVTMVDKNRIGEFIHPGIFGILGFIIIFNLSLFILGFIFKLFQKLTIQLKQDSIVIKDKKETKTIYYKDVSYITFSLGEISKTQYEPSLLNLFDKDLNYLCQITNPSLLMTYLIKKKCINAKLSYYHHKRILWLLAIFIGVSLVLGLVYQFGLI